MKTQIPLYKVHWTEDDVNAVTQVIRRGMYWTGGPENQVFENAVASYVGRKHGVSFNSGTSALTALLLAHGVGPGDEVIVPAFTYPSTADAVKFAGATPVYADIEEETYGLDIDDAEKRITEKTRAVIAVHVYGLPCFHIRELCVMAKTHGLLLIEDAAEALGAATDSERVGSFGDAAFFSFSGGKVVSTGEGGMAVTDSEEVERKLREVRQSRSWRMSSIQAALGLSQFKRLEHLIEGRRMNAWYLSTHLPEIEGVRPPPTPWGRNPTYQFYTVRVERGRDRLKALLEEKGVTTKVYFEPLSSLPTTTRVAGEVLTLPMYPELTPKEMNYILECVREFAEV